MANYYEILNVDLNATPEQIKDAYRIMAMKWHPDRNINNRELAEKKFKEIGSAYKVLFDPVQRKDYDQWLEEEKKQSSKHSFSHNEDISGKDAENMFFESMLDLAMELARRGYDMQAITKALIALDCPESIAKVVAKNAFSQNMGRNKQTPKHETTELSEWRKWAPYFESALTGPDFVPSDSGNFIIIKTVRMSLFISTSAVLFGLYYSNVTNPDADELIGMLILSVLVGWGCMFGILQLSSTHKNYLYQERLNNYIKTFETIFNSKNKWTETSSAIFFPAPWFGFYGLLWPLVAVTAVFFAADFLLLVNVKEDIVNQETLLSIWEVAQKPWASIIVWVTLGSTFNFLFFTETKKKLTPFFNSKNLDKAKIYNLCKPKLWRAIVVTVVFFLTIMAPQQFIFPTQTERINAAVKAKTIPPLELYREALSALSNIKTTISKKAIPIYLQTAAEENNVEAQRELGILYKDGNIVVKDMHKAIFWLEKSANGGDVWSKSTLGHFYYDPRYGVAKDDAKALTYLSEAAKAGDGNAQISLGWAYMQGDLGLTVDYAKAVYWNNLAAAQGFAEGDNNLGWLYENGLGVKKSYDVASDLYREASKKGNKESTERLSALLAKVASPQDLENQKLDTLITDLESRYPELNKASPKYDQKIVDEVLSRQKVYIQQGQPPSTALRSAVADMTQPVSPAQNNH